MPMYDLACSSGHEFERYMAISEVDNPRPCDCGDACRVMITRSQPLTYFRENNGQWIWNIGPDPIYITSHEQHVREMKKHKVTPATPKRGMPGAW